MSKARAGRPGLLPSLNAGALAGSGESSRDRQRQLNARIGQRHPPRPPVHRRQPHHRRGMQHIHRRPQTHGEGRVRLSGPQGHSGQPRLDEMPCAERPRHPASPSPRPRASRASRLPTNRIPSQPDECLRRNHERHAIPSPNQRDHPRPRAFPLSHDSSGSCMRTARRGDAVPGPPPTSVAGVITRPVTPRAWTAKRMGVTGVGVPYRVAEQRGGTGHPAIAHRPQARPASRRRASPPARAALATTPPVSAG
jgi:hypothetical protein